MPGSAASVDRFFELSLLGLVASGYFAVVGSGYLDPPTAILTGAGLLLRAVIATGVLRLAISPRLVTLLTLAYIGFYPLDCLYISSEFVPATVHLVFFLAVMKVITAKATRDHVFVAVIAFLELLAASVLSTSLNFFAFLALFLLFGVATFASAEIRRSMRKPRNLARGALRNLHWRLGALTVTLSLAILALTGGLFFLLPRTAQAAFRHLVPQRYKIPGFSNEMVLGEIGEIQKRSDPVMHVRFSGNQRPSGLKWRGAALSEFDGRRWFNPIDPGQILRVDNGMLELSDHQSPWRAKTGLSYEVQLTSTTSDALFFAGYPQRLRIDIPLVIRTGSASYRIGFGAPDGLHYGVYSALDPPPAGQLGKLDRARNLSLPRLDPRIAALARQVTQYEAGDAERARAVESYLRTSYGYTLELPSREAPDPLANFLFERREGHCEYFASAMAVMLRAVGIPARVANGFQSGVYNPVSGWYVVRASDAHSWVEAWLPGRGWTTFDPTPADPNASRISLWSRIGFYFDAAETFWREWVLNYDLDRQLDLAFRMENSGRSFGVQWVESARSAYGRLQSGTKRFVTRYGAALAGIALALFAIRLYGRRVWNWWKALERVRQVQRGAARASDATLLYARMLAVLRRRGYEKPSWITPSEFARVLPADGFGPLVADFTSAYNDLRYGGSADAAPRMMELLGRIESA